MSGNDGPTRERTLARIDVDGSMSGAPESPPASDDANGRAIVVFVQIMPRARVAQTSQISASMTSSISGAIFTIAGPTAARIRSRCSGRCSSRNDGVFGDDRLTTTASAYGASFIAQAP